MYINASRMKLSAPSPVVLYSDLIEKELRQSMDEGKDVEKYAELARVIAQMDKTPIREELADVFFRAVSEAPMRADYPYVEPNDLQSIRAARPKDIMTWQPPEKDDLLLSRFRGAWLGRVCGCLLGKPFECWARPNIERLLRSSNNFPAHRYAAHSESLAIGINSSRAKGWIDLIGDHSPSDDDTNYTALAAHIIETYGRDFTPDDVAEAWLRMQPVGAYCTAERVAFVNFIQGMRAPESATYKNPEREYIGAQIRGDYFGYINPGNPELAAEMAWRDACISHVHNGIYGEMFVAAMLAIAAVCDDLRTIVTEGLKQIPEKSRLYEDVGKVVRWYDEGVSCEECFDRIHEEWDENDFYRWSYTNSNAMVVAAALLYSEKDYSRAIALSVQTGFDTDCNGATVGSVLGLMLTDAGIDGQWTRPVCGRLRTDIQNMEHISLDEAAELTLKHCAG